MDCPPLGRYISIFDARDCKETRSLIRTLHIYLARELAKVTILALIAFTLVLTVFAIMEPLRRRGLAGDQVIALFVYMLPVMLSLTLPVAALFAATIVYGRFAQDNELLACRASGISTISLLKPAWALGIVMTVASLLLSNFVTPKMARMGEVAVKANVEGIVCNALNAKGHYWFGPLMIYADEVKLKGRDGLKNDTAYGVVAVEYRNPKEVHVLAAPRAEVSFIQAKEEGGGDSDQGDSSEVSDTYVTFSLTDPFATSGQDMGRAEFQGPVQQFRLPSLAREKAAYFLWDDLWRMKDAPVQHRLVRRELESIRQSVRQEAFARKVAAAINASHVYGRLSDRQYAYSIKAGGATVELGSRAGGWGDRPAIVKLTGPEGPDGKTGPVEVTLLQGGRPADTMTAQGGQISFSARGEAMMANILLAGKDGVLAHTPRDTEPRSLADYRSGEIAIQDDLLADLPAGGSADRRRQLEDMYRDIRQYTSNSAILGDMEDLQKRVIAKIVGEVIGELNGRMAYGVSCFLLVAMGAALGLIYRGGQIISAFALCVLPAAVVIIMVLMGQRLVSDPSVQKNFGIWLGLGAIWSGNAALLIANTVIYVRLMRR
ncbi:MAG: LptF/LptG family permease [Phycisphaerae bacterium]